MSDTGSEIDKGEWRRKDRGAERGREIRKSEKSWRVERGRERERSGARQVAVRSLNPVSGILWGIKGLRKKGGVMVSVALIR